MGRISRTLILVVICIAGFTATTTAQDARRITFTEAVRIALEQNPTIKRADNGVEIGRVGVSRARMAFYPDLALSTSGSQNYGRNFLPEEGRIINTTTEYVGFDASTNVTLFDGFQNTATLAQARHNLRASEHDLERTRETVVFEVASRYVTLVERREQIKVQETNLQSAQQQLTRIQAFTESGARPVSDLYQQQAEVANAELAVLNAERDFQNAEANLIQVMQLDPFGKYEFETPVVDTTALVLRQLDINAMLRSAFDNRDDLKAADIDILSAQEGIRIARSSRYPSVGAGFSYGSNYISGVPFSFFDQLDQRRGGNLGVRLSIPLFDRKATSNSVQQARVQYDNAQLALDELQQTVAVQVRQAYLEYQSALKTLEVTQKQERSALQAFEAAQERYNVQAATLVEVTQARATLVSAQSGLVRARYSLLFQSRVIDYYLGELDLSELQ